eukprot:1159606-Pelagomonas_calceolata.AAC.11
MPSQEGRCGRISLPLSDLSSERRACHCTSGGTDRGTALCRGAQTEEPRYAGELHEGERSMTNPKRSIEAPALTMQAQSISALLL